MDAADIGDPDAAEDVCHRALAEIGSFDTLINNVGGRRVNVPTEELDPATWREMMELNLTSTFLCSRLLGGAMIEAGQGGRIINVASINAFVAGRGIGGRHYETAKAAVLQFTGTLAVDWAPRGITANAICPGLFATAPNLRWQESPRITLEPAPTGSASCPIAMSSCPLRRLWRGSKRPRTERRERQLSGVVADR